jgi:anti-anti-sigma regulatory factor
VVFSFFRKGDEAAKPKAEAPLAPKPAQPSPAARAPAPAQPVPAPSQPAAASPPPPPKPAETIGTGGMEANSLAATEMGSAVEEAAILYASDHADQAAGLLVDFIKSHPGKELQPWMMLFEIYQIMGLKKQFDELTMEFVVKFERSAPIWSDDKVPGAKKEKGPTGAAAEGYVSLTGVLSGDKDSLFQNLVQTAQKGAGLRVDFSRLQGVDASGSRRLVETLQGLKKDGKKITPLSVPHLTDILKGMLGQGGEDEQAHWELLLNLYQCQGLQQEFEDLAVEYAVTFEVSPPSWEVMPQCKQVSVVAVEATPEAKAEPDPDAFFLTGVISTDSEHQLMALERYAEPRSEVYLDMTDVVRIDFGSIGNVVGVLATLNAKGKKLMIRNANEMIRALFKIMGVEDFATIMRRKIG